MFSLRFERGVPVAADLASSPSRTLHRDSRKPQQPVHQHNSTLPSAMPSATGNTAAIGDVKEVFNHVQFMKTRTNDISVDLRSDTVTRPTQAMREAMCHAEVGDDVYGEDPTVNELQRVAAEVLGKEAAILVSSGTMGNLAALLAHCEQRGSEAILGNESHIYHYEAGGISVLGGIAFNLLPNLPNGEIPLDQIKKAVRPEDEHFAKTACICLESTQNRCGGKVLSLEYLQSVKEFADSKGIPVHIDGARIFNAAAALGVPVSEITQHVTTVQLCLSKGLGAPMGSIVAGPKEFIGKVLKIRKMLGGGTRQAGVIAAPGLLAVTDMSRRLHIDHENAQILAKGLAEMPLIDLDPKAVHSNIVVFRLKPEAGMSPASFAVALQKLGVMIVPFVHDTIRAVTHVDVRRDQLQHVLDMVKQVLQASNTGNGHANGVKSPYGDW